ncbi:unnamed protein product [Adineta steineri]|uniref:Beta-lactamase-related domain-containing protein n=1 Tax=Adineta steineri TaxID=433720 RepID=A0A813UFL1_9BILA|nr:unnamed protein product [Adineta steineri]
MAYLYVCIVLFIFVVNNSVSLSCPSRQWIEESLNNSYVPGAAIIVVNATHTLYEEAFGYHSLLPPKWIDIDRSIFTLASISKTFIATAVMQLVEQEVVDLDTDINQYLLEPDHRIFHPNYSTYSITLRKLLSHSSSIAVDENIQLGLYRLGDASFEQATLAEILFRNVNPYTSSWLPKPPGSVSFYSNYGSSLAALVVERMTNISFDQYVKEKIMKPLQIDITQVGVRLADFKNREDIVKHYAYALNASHLNAWTEGMPQLNVTPFSNNFPTWLNIPLFGFSAYPAGLFRMSAQSLSRFLQMFINNGSTVLSSRSIAEMKLVVGNGLIPLYDPDNILSTADIPQTNFGLSWYWQTLSDGHRYICHSGSVPGSRHWMLVNEQHSIGIIFLSNADSNVPNDRSKQLHKSLERWSNTSNMNQARQSHTASVLKNGKVLVASGSNGSVLNSAELYNPSTETWTTIDSMHQARVDHTASILADGKVLVVGGFNGGRSRPNIVDPYDPSTESWTVTSNINQGRDGHTASILTNGKYDPATGTWTTTGNLNQARYSHTASVLNNGKVLVAGGFYDAMSRLNSAELYDPSTGIWEMTGSMNEIRFYHTASVLTNGNVLVAGGVSNGPLNSAELYDLSTETWIMTTSMNEARYYHTASVLGNGTVLVTAGLYSASSILNTAELYDPLTKTWAIIDNMNQGRYLHTASILTNERVLVTGGFDEYFNELSSAELY